VTSTFLGVAVFYETFFTLSATFFYTYYFTYLTFFFGA